MRDKVNEYIAEHELSWAPSTIKSERHRLYSVAAFLDGNPLALWSALQNLKPYSRQTTWVRVVDFWGWLRPNEVNPYETFRKKNARLFKHVYQPREVSISFEEAKSRINRLPNPGDRKLALRILSSGERFSEAVQDSANVVGKGGKRRHTYRLDVDGSDRHRSYSSFSRALATVDLKAHDLRKICATRLVEEGMAEADLLKVMGWSSIATAKVYLQPKREDAIRAIFKRLHKDLE